MKHIRDGLKEFSKQFGSLNNDNNLLIKTNWEQIVGKDNVSEIFFLSIRNAEIHLKTSSPQLFNKWKFKAKDISEKVSSILGMKSLIDVRINKILIKCK